MSFETIKLSRMFFLIPALGLLIGTPGNSFAAAEDDARFVMSRIGNVDGLNQRILAPMTSASTPLTTLGESNDPESPGPREFHAEMPSAASDIFLEVQAVPGPTGDITRLTVRQDTNFDNTLDAAYDAPVTASGVCRNGIIACDPGTWDNCRFYLWAVTLQAGAGETIFLNEVEDMRPLDSCYCINTHCGSDIIARDFSSVLRTIGNGVVEAFQAANPEIMVANVSTNQNTIRYYGRLSSDMNAGQGGPVYFSGSANPQQYYDPQGGVLPDEQEALAQQADRDSPYRQLHRSHHARLHPMEKRTCRISNIVTIGADSLPHLSHQDDCGSLDLENCVLDRETVCDFDNRNCHDTIVEGQATGPAPEFPAMIIADLDAGVSYEVSATGTEIAYTDGNAIIPLATGADMWWHIRREYLCDTGGQPLATEDDLTAANVAMGSVERSGNMISYSHYDPETGTTTQRQSQLPDLPEYGDCETSCKVQAPVTDTQANLNANTWDYQRSVDSVRIIYKSCGIDNVCPVEPGETIVQDCACQNEFAYAVSYMQVLDEASKDMICAP